MTDKIIHSFQERRQLSQAMDALGETGNEAELIRSARTLVQRFDEDQVLIELLRRLDTPNSQLRGGLGHVAALLTPEKVTPVLRTAAADRQNEPQVRIAAALLLERFLGQDLPLGLMSDLDQSNEVALQSLREAIEESAENRHILLEYVTQMRQAEAGVALMVMELLSQLSPADQVDILRLIAQDIRPAVSRQALQRLEQLGGTESGTETGTAAARALYTLAFVLPPELATLAERSMRKLQLSGARYVPPEPSGWFALISPYDVAGNQTVWCAYRSDAHNTGAILGFVLSPSGGILQTFAGDKIARAFVPEPPGLGKQTLVEVGGPQPLLMLQAPFDFARGLIQRGLARHWSTEPNQPLGGEFELYGDLIWEFVAPRPSPLLEMLLDESPDPEGAGADAPKVDQTSLAASVETLFARPVVAAWIPQFRAILDAMDGTLIDWPDDVDEADLQEATERVLVQFAQLHASYNLSTLLNEALQGQAAWLYLAGDEEGAYHARQLARSLTLLPLHEHPLLATLVAGALSQAQTDA